MKRSVRDWHFVSMGTCSSQRPFTQRRGVVMLPFTFLLRQWIHTELKPGPSLRRTATLNYLYKMTVSVFETHVVLLFKKLLYMMCMCACLFVGMCVTCLQVLVETRRHQIPWNWSYRQLLAAWWGCWEPNLGDQVQQVLSTVSHLCNPENPFQSQIHKSPNLPLCFTVIDNIHNFSSVWYFSFNWKPPALRRLQRFSDIRVPKSHC